MALSVFNQRLLDLLVGNTRKFRKSKNQVNKIRSVQQGAETENNLIRWFDSNYSPSWIIGGTSLSLFTVL